MLILKNWYDVNIISTNGVGKYKWKVKSFLFRRRNICQIINPQFTKVNGHSDCIFLPTIIISFFPGFVVDTCGPPKIQNTMMNQTVVPGEYAHFKCQVWWWWGGAGWWWWSWSWCSWWWTYTLTLKRVFIRAAE